MEFVLRRCEETAYTRKQESAGRPGSPFNHETKIYFAGAGRVRAAAGAVARPRGESFAAARHRRDSGAHLFGAQRSGDSGSAGAAARAARASAGIFTGSGSALVADLVPFGGAQIRDEFASAQRKSGGGPGVSGYGGEGRDAGGGGPGETRIGGDASIRRDGLWPGRA